MATEAEKRQRAIGFVNLTGNILINKIKAGQIPKSPTVEKLRTATRQMKDAAVRRAMQGILAKMIAIPEPGVSAPAVPVPVTAAPPVMSVPTPEPMVEPMVDFMPPEPVEMMVDSEEEEPTPEPTLLAPETTGAPAAVPGAPVPFQQDQPLLDEKPDPFSKPWVLAIPLIVAVIPFLLGRR